MAWLTNPDPHARRVLFGCNLSEMARKTGLDRGRLHRIKSNPGRISLDELAAIAHYLGLTDAEVIALVRERG